jgi:hypothetical protein
MINGQDVQHYDLNVFFNRKKNKTDCHDQAEILLKVVLNTINLNQPYSALEVKHHLFGQV